MESKIGQMAEHLYTQDERDAQMQVLSPTPSQPSDEPRSRPSYEPRKISIQEGELHQSRHECIGICSDQFVYTWRTCALLSNNKRGCVWFYDVCGMGARRNGTWCPGHHRSRQVEKWEILGTPSLCTLSEVRASEKKKIKEKMGKGVKNEGTEGRET